jgi:DNA-binding GntR family transcriptional regulator
VKLRLPENLTQQAYRLIRGEIITGRLDGRQHLTENSFARRFGISKSPIREALNRLESEGLIQIIPRRGAFVSQFSIADVEEIYDLREVLEALVVRDAVLDSGTFARMRQAVRAAQSSLGKNDKRSYVLHDTAFHVALAQASSNKRLKKILENMQNQLLVLRGQTFELTSHNSVKQHAKILEALEKGRREAAERLMVDHIRSVRQRLVTHLASQSRQASSTTQVKGPIKRK